MTTKRRLNKHIRKAILATINLLENKHFQRKVLSIGMSVAILMLSKTIMETVGQTEDCSALLIAIPVGIVNIIKEVVS